MNQFSRTELLYSKEAMGKLKNAKIAVFGIGGVGGYVVEALVRSGIGHIDIIDNDIVSLTNLNRQIIATHQTIGRDKVEVMKERILSINPDIEVHTFKCFFLPENKDQFDFSEYSYIVDAIDTITAKIELVLEANKNNVPILSCMGTGNKIDPTALEISDIYKTSVCPLAKVMRRELKKKGIKHLKVVYSKEVPIKANAKTIEETQKRSVPGSNSFVPACAGLIIASEVIKDITNDK